MVIFMTLFCFFLSEQDENHVQWQICEKDITKANRIQTAQTPYSITIKRLKNYHGLLLLLKSLKSKEGLLH
jgi:hypothetical protein